MKKRVAEVIHIVESEREKFLDGAIKLDDEETEVLWRCGVRKQQYFALGELIFMTFEYNGEDFKGDMARMAAYLEKKGHLVKMRRKDVPEAERATTNWWAPVKRIASLLESEPAPNKQVFAKPEDYMAMLDGFMSEADISNDISFDEDDWTEGMHI